MFYYDILLEIHKKSGVFKSTHMPHEKLEPYSSSFAILKILLSVVMLNAAELFNFEPSVNIKIGSESPSLRCANIFLY